MLRADMRVAPVTEKGTPAPVKAQHRVYDIRLID